MLDREEYIEQAHFFHALKERLVSTPAQELLEPLKEELLATTKLPMAIDFMAAELRLKGALAPAFAKLRHYFTPFQAFVVGEAENERGKFDLRVALEILEREATYRAAGAGPQGLFLYQFECLCRNRLGYDHGLEAVAGDPMYDAAWREWILIVRRQVGLVDLADLIHARSRYYWQQRVAHGETSEGPAKPILFGEKEGRIAAANRRKDPLLLFAALSRQLGYPQAPRPKPVDQTPDAWLGLSRRLERIESHLKLIEEDIKGKVDLTKFYSPKPQAGGDI